MALYLIGLGLNDEKDISVKGLELVKKADFVYLENYTSVLSCTKEQLELFYGKKIILANRELIEQNAEKTILKQAKTNNVALLIIGDPLCATTHVDLWQRAKKSGIKTEIVHNASIVSAIGVTGLQVYKFGKITSVPFVQGDYIPETSYNAIKDNQNIGLHTLLLLDLDPEKNRFLTINDAINILLKIELKRNEKIFTPTSLCIGCARIGSKNQKIVKGKAKELLKEYFGKPPYCLIIPGKMHFVEEELFNE